MLAALRGRCLRRQYSGASSLPEVVPSSSWEIKPEDITIAKHSDGSDWEIGSGGLARYTSFSLPHMVYWPGDGHFPVANP